MIKGCDGEEEEEVKKDKNGENSGPLMLLPVNGLNNH